jgi:hypothetical protein
VPELDGPAHDLVRLIEVLDCHGVEYLVCGGAAAQAYGVDRPTEDTDCVVRRERANLDRLAVALRELHGRLRVAGLNDDEARLLPVQLDGGTLADLSLTTWMTDAGPFDVLDGLEAEDGRVIPYEELAGRASTLYVSGIVVRAAALEDIIIAKQRADRPKDREALPALRAKRDERAAGQSASIAPNAADELSDHQGRSV